MTTELTGQNFDDTLHDADNPVLVDFFAPWCHPCLLQSPVVDEFADAAEGKYSVYKVNVDESPAIARRFGIQSIPTLIVFEKGEIAARLTGLQSRQTIQAALMRTFNGNSDGANRGFW